MSINRAITEVEDDVWAIPAPLPNGSVVYCYLVGGDTPALIDAGYSAHVASVIQPGLAHLGLSLEAVSTVLLTHGHPDHAGGASAIRKASGAYVRLHAEDAAPRRGIEMYLKSGLDFAAGCTPDGPEFDARRQFVASHDCFDPVDETFRGGETIDLGDGRVLIAIHTPGHTPGSVTYLLLPNRVMFTGDAVQGHGGANGLPFYTDADRYTASQHALQPYRAAMLCLAHPYAWSGGRFGTASAVRTGPAVVGTLEDSLSVPASLHAALQADPSLRCRPPADLMNAAGLPFDNSPAAILTARAHLQDPRSSRSPANS